jgi:NAD-dependent dihydropyrimidine dehydrogenase PreA subunit
MADDLAEMVALPVIDAGRCTLAASEGGSCRACVDGCPRKALTLEANNLYINLRDCDGCGACAAACSKGALTVPVEPLMDGACSARGAFAACSRAEAAFSPAPALVSCLHTIGLETLAELYRRSVRELVVATASCATCPSGAPQRLAARVASFNSLLSPQSMDQVQLVELQPVEWRRRRDEAVHAAKKAMRSAMGHSAASARRALLVTASAAPEVAEASGDPEAPTPAAPRINAQLCTGCLACVTVCPNDVFALTTRPGGRRELLVADGRRCTGCSMCSDACSAKSITIVRGEAQNSTGVALGYAVCKGCGGQFRLPVARADGRALCPHCSGGGERRDVIEGRSAAGGRGARFPGGAPLFTPGADRSR